jgi:hypothetical protein
MQSAINVIVGDAIEATKRMLEPKGYWQNLLASRQPDGTGSRFFRPVSEEEILQWDWTEVTEMIPEGNRLGGCRYYRAPQQGLLGIVPLLQVPQEAPVYLEDPKGTGKVSAVINRNQLEVELGIVNYTTLVVGPENGEDVIYTFHPGDPIRPSTVSAQEWAGKTVSPAEAIALGLEYAKING